MSSLTPESVHRLLGDAHSIAECEAALGPPQQTFDRAAFEAAHPKLAREQAGERERKRIDAPDVVQQARWAVPEKNPTVLVTASTTRGGALRLVVVPFPGDAPPLREEDLAATPFGDGTLDDDTQGPKASSADAP